MVTYGLCNYSECEQCNECKRYINKDSPDNLNPVLFRFKNICSQENNYQWQIKVESTELVVKEEGDA